MFCRSIFGEDALANLSIERAGDAPNATVTGHVRIRAKSQVREEMKILFLKKEIGVNVIVCLFQGMALSLGDKINKIQNVSHQKTAAATATAAF